MPPQDSPAPPDWHAFRPSAAAREAADAVFTSGFGVLLWEATGCRPAYYVLNHHPDYRGQRPA